jgi:hypothetical protein
VGAFPGGRAPSSLQHTFAKLLVLAEIQNLRDGDVPEFTTSAFAVNTLIGWYRSGADVAARMPILGTPEDRRRPTDTNAAPCGVSAKPDATPFSIRAGPSLRDTPSAAPP